ncbi:hypothetical protein NKH18_06670 [Streptomyces sp. M10(2022)]
MNTGLKITAFAAALAATFGTAYGVGKGVDPVTGGEQSAAHDGHGEAKQETGDGGGHQSAPAGGLQVSEGGYTLALETSRVPAGGGAKLRFSIQDENGRRITAYEREHDKELHFIVASRDLTVYRHLHPTRAADGTWSTSADLPVAGAYRAFADFKPAAKGAEGVTLGADLAVSGRTPRQRCPPRRHHEGRRLRGHPRRGLQPGRSGELSLKVARNGKPVTDLQPYLGAYGHLVALRSGDLAYLHVHPNGEPGDGTTEPGPRISFTATAPSSGTYRLFLDFQHEGTVHTAAFTVEAGRLPGVPSRPRQDPGRGRAGIPGHKH